jgi:hypothetical protein
VWWQILVSTAIRRLSDMDDENAPAELAPLAEEHSCIRPTATVRTAAILDAPQRRPERI